MEEKSFSWILQAIAGRQYNLPILSTYIISEGKPVTHICNKDNKLIISRPQATNVKELLLKLLADHQIRSRIKNIDSLVCYIITKKERLRVNESDMKEIIEHNSNKILQYIQPARPNADDFEIYYILRLEYTRTHFVSHFFRQVQYEKQTFYDSRLFEFACDIATTIMSIIESHTNKRVMIIEIEFLEDSSRMLWISFFRELKISEPILCQHFLVNTTEDLKKIPVKSLSSTKFTKLTNGQHIMDRKKNIKPPIDYTFSKGHIRNKRSDFGVDLSIHPPLGTQIETSRRSSSKMLVRSISIKNCDIRTYASQPRSNAKLSAKRARALRDEIMKSPELKTRYRLTGLVGVLGIEVEHKLQRSMSDSDINEHQRDKPLSKKRPTSRLIVREAKTPRSGRTTPLYSKK